MALDAAPSNANIAGLEAALARLHKAVVRGRSEARCLSLWSVFVRLRDGGRCVDCHATRRLAAHHICRKSFLKVARLDTGNGITLCPACHRGLHAGFNRRADLSLPMDAEGGEKIDAMERLYAILAQDAKERGILRDDFYYLSDDVLARFKLFQGFDYDAPFPGTRLQQAFLIWSAPPQHMLRAEITAMFADEA